MLERERERARNESELRESSETASHCIMFHCLTGTLQRNIIMSCDAVFPLRHIKQTFVCLFLFTPQKTHSVISHFYLPFCCFWPSLTQWDP